MPAATAPPADVDQTAAATRIEVYRRDLGITASALARTAGLDARTVRRIETRTRRPTLVVRRAVAAALARPVGELFDVAGDPLPAHFLGVDGVTA